MTTNDRVHTLGRVVVTLPTAWLVRERSADALSATTKADPPAALTLAFAPDDPEPPDAPLAQLVAGLFLEPEVGYEPLGPLEVVALDGFIESWQATGHLNVRMLDGRDHHPPVRCHIRQVLIAGPGDQRTHLLVVQPLATMDPSLDDELLRAIRPAPEAD